MRVVRYVAVVADVSVVVVAAELTSVDPIDAH